MVKEINIRTCKCGIKTNAEDGVCRACKFKIIDLCECKEAIQAASCQIDERRILNAFEFKGRVA